MHAPHSVARARHSTRNATASGPLTPIDTAVSAPRIQRGSRPVRTTTVVTVTRQAAADAMTIVEVSAVRLRAPVPYRCPATKNGR